MVYGVCVCGWCVDTLPTCARSVHTCKRKRVDSIALCISKYTHVYKRVFVYSYTHVSFLFGRTQWGGGGGRSRVSLRKGERGVLDVRVRSFLLRAAAAPPHVALPSLALELCTRVRECEFHGAQISRRVQVGGRQNKHVHPKTPRRRHSGRSLAARLDSPFRVMSLQLSHHCPPTLFSPRCPHQHTHTTYTPSHTHTHTHFCVSTTAGALLRLTTHQ